MSDEPSDHNDQPGSLAPWAALRYRNYSRLFLLSFFATTAQQMRQAQNFYQVYELSGSAVQLGLTGLAQGIPIFAFGLFGGTLADFIDRKRLLFITRTRFAAEPSPSSTCSPKGPTQWEPPKWAS